MPWRAPVVLNYGQVYPSDQNIVDAVILVALPSTSDFLSN